MGYSNLSNYSSLALSYLPVGYWDITQHTSELSLTPEASSIAITKANLSVSNRSLIYEVKDKSCMLLGATASASTITVPMTNLNFAKSGSDANPFTISFWYQQLSSTFSTTTPILAIGTDVKLFFSGEKFYMTFRGKTIYTSIPDWRELFFISIVFDGTTISLHINGYQGNSFGTDTKIFGSNTSIVFSSDDNSKFQIGGLAIYNYDLTLSQIEDLNESNNFIDRYALFNSNNLSKVVGSYFFDSNLLFSYSPDKSSSMLRNSIYSNGEIILPSKAMASVQGAPSFSATGATFTSSSGIKIPADDLDVMDSTLTFTISSLTTGSSGILFYIESGVPIYAKIVGLSLELYAGATKVHTVAVTSTSTIKIIFDGKDIYVDIDGTTSSKVYSIINSSFDYIMIGNNSELSQNLSTGKIRTVRINYLTNPLSQGKYILDLNNAYSVGTTQIKPKQDGVATWSVALPESFATTELIYTSSPTASVKTFLSTESVTDASWLSGSAGYAVFSGTSLKSSTGTPVTPTSGSRKIVKFTAYLNDTEVTTNKYIQSSPKISSILLKVFSDANVYSGNSNITMSSTDQDAFIISDSEASNSKKMIEGFKVYTDSAISLSNLNYPNNTSPSTVSIRLRMDDIQTAGTVDIITFTGPASTTKVSAVKSTDSYTLSFTNIATRYVDGVAYTSGTLTRYNDYILNLVLPAGVTAMTLQNLKGFAISSIDFFNSTLTSTDVLNQFSYSLGTDSLRITETSSSGDIFGIDSAPIVSIIDGYSIISS